MFAWAGNATAPGGFHRLLRGDKAAHVPLVIHSKRGALSVTFSDELDANNVKSGAFTFKVWSLKRSANYGSEHYDVHALEITAARVNEDRRTVTLTIPAIEPTMSYQLTMTLRAPDGAPIERSLHGTIHRLSEK